MTEGVPLQEKEKASCMVMGIHALREVRYFDFHLKFCLIPGDLVFLNECSEHSRHLFACRNSKKARRADKKGGKPS